MKGFAIRRCVLGSPGVASSRWSNRAITFRSLSRHGSRQLPRGCSRPCSLAKFFRRRLLGSRLCRYSFLLRYLLGGSFLARKLRATPIRRTAVGTVNQKPRPVFHCRQPRGRRTTSAPCDSGLPVEVFCRLRTFTPFLGSGCACSYRGLLGRGFGLTHRIHRTHACRTNSISATRNQELGAILGLRNPRRRALRHGSH